MTGAFVAVVGPSGSGKDALIDLVRESLAARPEFVFPRRTITREAGPGEDHDSLDESAFEAAEAGGAFALTWRAHGLAYGIPAEVRDRVAQGAVAVCNVSRETLDRLGAAFGRVCVVRVTAPDEVRLARIRSRGREDEDEVAGRLSRADPAPDHPADLEIRNDGTLPEAAARLVAFLDRVLASGGQTATSSSAQPSSR